MIFLDASWRGLSGPEEIILMELMKKLFILASGFALLAVRISDNHRHDLQECLKLRAKNPKLCGIEKRNPGKLSDIRWGLISPVRVLTQQNPSTPLKWGQKWVQILKSKTRNSPIFLAVQSSIWTGDHRQLPFWLIQKYRDQGLLQVLALSGQHVWALLFSFGVMGKIILRWIKIRRGKVLSILRKSSLLFTTLFLFSLAPGQTSMARTSLCALILFFLKTIPNQVNLLYGIALALILLLISSPDLLHSIGFILSMTGMIGVTVSGICFGKEQMIRKSFWIVFWCMPLYAFYFYRWVGHLVISQLGVGWIWDHFYLPLFFLWGILIVLLPRFLTEPLSQALERVLDLWLDWEALRPHFLPILIYRPTAEEMLLFWLWLVVLALWNRSIILSRAKLIVHSASRIDLERSARGK